MLRTQSNETEFLSVTFNEIESYCAPLSIQKADKLMLPYGYQQVFEDKKWQTTDA